MFCNKRAGVWINALLNSDGIPGISESIHPILMSNRQPNQLIPVKLPLRHKLVHQGGKAAVVGGHQQVGHLMNDDVFQAFRRLFCQIGIEADVP